MMPLVIPPVGGGVHQIARSLLFDGSSFHYLSRTPVSAGNRKTWTISAWVKRSAFGARQSIIGNTDNNGRNGIYLEFDASDRLSVGDYSTAWEWGVVTNRVFRDPSSWYHIVVAFDTTQAEAADRVAIYINGEPVSKSVAPTYPALNYDGYVGNTSLLLIARLGIISINFFSGYLAEIHHIDGLALTPDEFGLINPATGQWVPKRYAGSHGTNGFHLPFDNNASLITLGEDASGNGVDWALNNMTLDASVTDTPTDNHCVLNPLEGIGMALSDGNLFAAGNVNASTLGTVKGTIAAEHPCYFEFTSSTFSTDDWVGFLETDKAPVSSSVDAVGLYTNSVASRVGTGGVFADGGVVGTYTAITAKDIGMMAFDPASGKFWVGINGTWFNTGNPAAGTGQVATISALPTYVPAFSQTVRPNGVSFNFGQRPFAYTPPAGFKALSTKNLPDPLVVNPAKHFKTRLYGGNSGAQSITGVGFQPDLIWGKNRTTPASHFIVDSVRGDGRALFTNEMAAEVDNPSNYPLITPDGFDLAGGSITVNNTGDSYAAWCWKQGVTPGFDIVGYTGDGVAGRTIAHGLGDAPAMMIVKRRSSASGWMVYHGQVAADPATDYLDLSEPAAAADFAAVWNDTAPTNSAFTVGNDNWVNQLSETYIAYLFAEVPGFSRFGRYTGNGSADGPFVWCGFRPAFVMIKRTDAAVNWHVFDAQRNPSNLANLAIYPDLALAEGVETGNPIDMVSNGFKVRGSAGGVNANSATYIFTAFAEHPFKHANAR